MTMNILDDFEGLTAEVPVREAEPEDSTANALNYKEITACSDLETLLAGTKEVALKLTPIPRQFLMVIDTSLYLLNELAQGEYLLACLLKSDTTIVMPNAYVAQRTLDNGLTRNVDCLRILHRITNTPYPDFIHASSMLPLFHQLKAKAERLGCLDWYEKVKATQLLGRSAAFDIDRDAFDTVIATWKDDESLIGEAIEWTSALQQCQFRRVWGYRPADEEDTNLVRMLPVNLIPLGQVTGRFSSEPHMHGVPHELRKAFFAPWHFRPTSDHTKHVFLLVSGDFRQSQPRILYSLSHDEAYGVPLLDGSDIYKHCAAALFNKPYEEISDAERGVGKVVCVGLPYGMGMDKFAETLKAAGMECSEDEMEAMRTAFRQKFPTLFAWIDALPENEQFCVPNDEDDRYILKTPSGRMFFVPKKKQSARGDKEKRPWGPRLAALLAQAIEVEIVVDAILRFHAMSGPTMDNWGRVLHVVHDEILVYVDSADQEGCRNRLAKAMTEAFLSYPGMVDMQNVVKVSEAKPCWGDLK